MVYLFKNKYKIPDDIEFPKVRPKLVTYDFPSDIISDAQLEKSLNEKRITTINKELQEIESPNNLLVKCNIPWCDSNTIEEKTVDFIFSQAVLEHVENLDNTYRLMQKWLKPSGLMSHTIDFRSHGSSKIWNGHWTYSDYEWGIVKGGKDFLINRCPLSKHLDLHAKYGFTIVDISCDKLDNNIPKKYLAKKFQDLTEEDLTTSGAYILSRNNKS